jgi:putative ATP-binding cassette transporter
VDNYWRLIRAQRNLTLFTTGIGQSNSIVPYLIAAPGFFAGTLSLGSVVQTNIAYGQVSGALVWFVNAYQEIANWRASVERLVTFDAEIESTCAATAELRVDRGDGSELRLENVHLTRPDGEPMVGQASGVIRRGEHVALLGPMGSGKSTLLRAIAGIWHYGRGHISMPEDARTFFQPQRPYLPIGTLREVVSYPSPGDTFSDDGIRDALQQVGLGELADRLDESANWEQQLSTSEEQRLAFARMLLQKPDWIFLDKATSALDDASAQELHARLQQQLPDASIVSIADREGIIRKHQRNWTLVPGPDGSMLQAA